MKPTVSAIFGVAFALLGGTTAHAVTYANVSGVMHENLVQADAPAPDYVVGDWGTNPANVTVELAGDTTIYGGLVHANTARNQYLDGWTVDFGDELYNITFDWFDPLRSGDEPFDGAFIVDGVSYDLGQSGSMSLFGLTGRVTFVVDPVAGVSLPRETAHWSLHAAQVPLPKAGLLLVGAVCALSLVRRKRA